MSDYTLQAIRAITERYASSRAMEPLARLPSAPHIPFGLVTIGQIDEEAEQAAVLQSVEVAGPRYRIVSLGAAPGEHVVKAERAYRWRHPDGDFRSYCIEGDLDHVSMIHDFIAVNGADVAAYEVRYAAIAEKDGVARFPVINPVDDWCAGIAALADRAEDLDAHMTITESQAADRVGANGGKPLAFREVEAISLASLLGTIGQVDFLHSDIQAAEAKVFPPQMDAMDQYVRVVCISTHSVEIGQALRTAFEARGWLPDFDHECGFNEHGQIVRDGVMIFRNPRRAG